MVVLRSAQAENITSCNGVIHLPAGRHTLVAEMGCGNCQIVGEPGTILVAPVTCRYDKNHTDVGDLTLSGSLVVEGHGDPQCLDTFTGLLILGNISIKDCIMGSSTGELWPLRITGAQSGETMVSITNSSLSLGYSLWPRVTISNGARVTLSDFSFSSTRQDSFQIQNSFVIFQRGSFYLEDGQYSFGDSTIIATNTNFETGHGKFFASNSVLNFTNSTVDMVGLPHAEGQGFIGISNCSVDVTCGGWGPEYSPGQGPVFSSAGGSMSIDDSMVRFRQCSCHLDQAISLDQDHGDDREHHTLSFTRSSVTFSKCQANRESSKGDPVVVVVV